MTMSAAPIIRRLTPADRQTLIAYLEQDRANNLFHLANLAQNGMEHPDLRYYGAFAGEVLVGELMLMRRSAGVVWDDPACLPPFARLLVEAQIEGISGQRQVVEPLLALRPAGSIERLLPAVFARVTAQTLRGWPPRGERLATPSDVEMLADLYAQNLFRGDASRAEHKARVERVLATGGLVAFVERHGRAVSAARTSAIGHGLAMIGGVVTTPAFRQQGLARACTGLLSRTLLDLGIAPHLTYDPTDAGASRAYQTLGYEAIGEWLIAFLKTI